MKVETCSNCGKIIETKATTCDSCGAKYCESCEKMCGDSCLFCGEKKKHQ